MSADDDPDLAEALIDFDDAIGRIVESVHGYHTVYSMWCDITKHFLVKVTLSFTTDGQIYLSIPGVDASALVPFQQVIDQTLSYDALATEHGDMAAQHRDKRAAIRTLRLAIDRLETSMQPVPEMTPAELEAERKRHT